MINPVQGFKEASAPKKAAIVAGTAAAAVGIASLAYAAKTGKAFDVFKKAEEGAEQLKLTDKVKGFGAGIVEGYKGLGSKIAQKATSAVEWVKSHLPKKAQVEDLANDVVEGAAENL